jgi:hypothetical protein
MTEDTRSPAPELNEARLGKELEQARQATLFQGETESGLTSDRRICADPRHQKGERNVSRKHY